MSGGAWLCDDKGRTCGYRWTPTISRTHHLSVSVSRLWPWFTFRIIRSANPKWRRKSNA